ncbi:hypothetical protein ASA1KI_42540 [Opitutales bacterium ASA1]|nr:hypothetical protein ASA1KI_42540 [Opitutales bacterium ASA1]
MGETTDEHGCPLLSSVLCPNLRASASLRENLPWFVSDPNQNTEVLAQRRRERGVGRVAPVDGYWSRGECAERADLDPIGRPDIVIPVQSIEINPEVCNGRPVVRGTRITVQTILGYLSAGDTVDDVLEAYPQLGRSDVLACLEYARRLGESRSILRLAS